MRKVVGLDISLQKTAVCVLDRDGQLIWQGKADSEPGPLIDKLQLWRDQIDVMGLEACPLSEWLHRHLVAAGFKAVCVETRHAQRFLSTRPVKTDGNDARGACASY
jgi:transposase